MIGEYLTFKRMITPIILQVLFWFAVLFVILVGAIAMIVGLVTMLGQQPDSVANGIMLIIAGLAYMIVGPIAVRIYAEILIVIFRLNETLTDMSRSLKQIEHNTWRPGA